MVAQLEAAQSRQLDSAVAAQLHSVERSMMAQLEATQSRRLDSVVAAQLHTVEQTLAQQQGMAGQLEAAQNQLDSAVAAQLHTVEQTLAQQGRQLDSTVTAKLQGVEQTLAKQGRQLDSIVASKLHGIEQTLARQLQASQGQLETVVSGQRLFLSMLSAALPHLSPCLPRGRPQNMPYCGMLAVFQTLALNTSGASASSVAIPMAAF